MFNLQQHQSSKETEVKRTLPKEIASHTHTQGNHREPCPLHKGHFLARSRYASLYYREDPAFVDGRKTRP